MVVQLLYVQDMSWVVVFFVFGHHTLRDVTVSETTYMEKRISIFLQSTPAAGHKSNMLKMTTCMMSVT